jgi:hypothetical protein
MAENKGCNGREKNDRDGIQGQMGRRKEEEVAYADMVKRGASNNVGGKKEGSNSVVGGKGKGEEVMGKKKDGGEGQDGVDVLGSTSVRGKPPVTCLICHKAESEHGTKKVRGEWMGCDECWGWAMQVCVKRMRKGEKIDTEERFKCQECRDVQEGLKVVVKEWGVWREKLEEVNIMQKGCVQTERGRRLILEKQVGALEGEVRMKEIEVRHKSREIEAMKLTPGKGKEAEAEVEGRMRALQKELENGRQEVGRCRREVEERDRVVGELRGLLGEKDMEIRRLRAEVERWRGVQRKEGVVTVVTGEKRGGPEERGDGKRRMMEVGSGGVRSMMGVSAGNVGSAGEKVGIPVVGRRAVAKKGVLWVGNSNIQHLVDRRWEVAAYERRWEVRMKRGGKIKDIRELVEREDLGGFKAVVVMVGGNDVSRLSEERGWREIPKVVVEMERIIMRCKREGVQLVVINPPPRGDVPEGVRGAMRRAVHEVMGKGGEEGRRVVEVCQQGEERVFMQKVSRDGVHFDGEIWEGVMQKVVKLLEEEVVKPGEGFKEAETRELLGMTRGCWRCGSKEHRQVGCAGANLGCGRCGTGLHGEGACYWKVRRCIGCGKWGHRTGSDMCEVKGQGN